MTRPSTNLATVIAEAIQDHANHYRCGAPETREVIEALSKVGCVFMNDVADPLERYCLASRLFDGLFHDAEKQPSGAAAISQ